MQEVLFSQRSSHPLFIQDKVVGYTSDLAASGRDLLAQQLGLEHLAIPPSMEAPNMRMLKLPGIPRACRGIADLKVMSQHAHAEAAWCSKILLWHCRQKGKVPT